MKLKTDKLPVSAYVRHGDMCTLGSQTPNFHDRLGCASGYKAGDYVLVARFAYLQEGDHEYDNSNPAECNCGWEGTVGDLEDGDDLGELPAVGTSQVRT
jgi:hypothetical protein